MSKHWFRAGKRVCEPAVGHSASSVGEAGAVCVILLQVSPNQFPGYIVFWKKLHY